MASDPVPTSPTSSTPEPDTSSVPLDNATIPSAAMQAPTGTDTPALYKRLWSNQKWIDIIEMIDLCVRIHSRLFYTAHRASVVITVAIYTCPVKHYSKSVPSGVG